MNKAQHNVAFIPMRGGSKSIPHKNIKSIAGKPLYAWSIQAAIDSKVFDEIFVSTDAPLIREHVENTFGSQVTVIDRPSELAQDTTSTEAVMLDFVHQFDFQTITLIQVTNPFTTARDFQHAFEKFKKENLDSLLTASTCKRFLWDHQAKPVNYNPLQRPRRQDFEGLLMENGAFYITKKTTLLSHQNRLGGNIGIFEMNEVSSFEIDEPHDWTIVEKLLQKEKITPILQNIQAIGVDVDGTLTDGGMYYSPEGEALKKFNTKDAVGLKLLEKSGIKVCIITAENSKTVDARMKKLGIEHYFKGITDKKTTLDSWLETHKLSWQNFAYIGDDIGDLEAMQNCAFSFCPKDASEEIQKHASYILHQKGGEAAVREACEIILKAKS